MATYYVSWDYGDDANNGLGPNPAHATNKPWKTLGKALGASGIASGDIVYLAPGTQREAVSVAMTSPVAETQVLGDPGNAQGFMQTGGVLGVVPGSVVVSGYTTNDTTAPSAAATLDLNGCDYLTFQNIWFVGSALNNPNVIKGTVAHSTNITFRDCAFYAPGGFGTVSALVAYTGAADTAANWLFDRCLFEGGHCRRGLNLVFPTSASADYDVDFQVRNCRFTNLNLPIIVSASGASAFKAGGLDVLNSLLLAGNNAINIGSNISTSIPCTVYNSVLMSNGGTVLQSSTSGSLVEDYNFVLGSTARSNVTAGTNSSSDGAKAALFHFGQELLFNKQIRPYGMPTAGSPLLGFGDNGSAPSVDMLNRPRPAGGGSTSKAVGALERHDTAAQETSVVDAGGTGLKITGPGDHDLLIPVDAASTSITIKVRYDTNHGTGSKPQAQIVANPEIGVTGETKTATVGTDTWETLTFSSFTPSRKGWVRLRLISRAAAGSGIAYFDTLGVS